jgi:hypothetical protein
LKAAAAASYRVEALLQAGTVRQPTAKTTSPDGAPAPKKENEVEPVKK